MTIIILMMLGEISRKFDVPKRFIRQIGKLVKLQFGVYETMIANRQKSIMTMVSDVFLKQIRRLHYNKIYEDPRWKNRLIMNSIHELKDLNIIKSKFQK